MTIKKISIEKPNLPPLSPNGEYILRYRIISDDRNRTSAWSPIYVLDATPFISLVDGNVLVTGQNITITWDDVNARSSYDVFVKFDFVIEHKQLTDNVASITTKNLSDIKVGDKIIVSGIDSTFDGTHTVTEIVPASKIIRYSKIAANVSYSGASGIVSLGFIHHGISTIHTYSLLAKSGAETVEALIQLEGIEKIPATALKIYESPTPVDL
jgi:hypothetical protein